MFNLLLSLLNINYYKKFGKNLYFIYGGNDSKLYNVKKSLKEKLYKIGEVSSGIFYYKDSFQNMISIYFRITGVLLCFIIIFIFIIYPIFFFDKFEFFSLSLEKKNFYILNFYNEDLLKFKDIFFCTKFKNSIISDINLDLEILLLLFFFKFIIFLTIFCFFFHILKKVYMFIIYDFFNIVKNSGYNHFLVKNKKI